MTNDDLIRRRGGSLLTVRVDYRLRMKIFAKTNREKLTVSEFVRRTLQTATEGPLSPEDEERTFAFLEECAGSWSGPETVEETMQVIKGVAEE